MFMSETQLLENIKKIADRYGVWEEFKKTYDIYRSNGATPEMAGRCALYDCNL
jgi:hypothetical protein